MANQYLYNVQTSAATASYYSMPPPGVPAVPAPQNITWPAPTWGTDPGVSGQDFTTRPKHRPGFPLWQDASNAYVASDGNELNVAFDRWNNSLVSDAGKRVDATEAVVQYWPQSNFGMDGNRPSTQALITYNRNSCIKAES
jgi:hypothetical protein